MTQDTSKAIEQDRELTPDELEAVSAGAFEIFVPIWKGIHALNPQPLPPG